MYIKENTQEKISHASDVARIARAVLDARPTEEQHKEYFYMIGLNSKNIIQVIDLISFGTVNQAGVYIREIVRTAIIKNCVSVIVFHNHPSGEITPSREDRNITGKIRQALKLLDIQLLDHVIIGSEEAGFYSLSDDMPGK